MVIGNIGEGSHAPEGSPLAVRRWVRRREGFCGGDVRMAERSGRRARVRARRGGTPRICVHRARAAGTAGMGRVCGPQLATRPLDLRHLLTFGRRAHQHHEVGRCLCLCSWCCWDSQRSPSSPFQRNCLCASVRCTSGVTRDGHGRARGTKAKKGGTCGVCGVWCVACGWTRLERGAWSSGPLAIANIDAELLLNRQRRKAASRGK